MKPTQDDPARGSFLLLFPLDVLPHALRRVIGRIDRRAKLEPGIVYDEVRVELGELWKREVLRLDELRQKELTAKEARLEQTHRRWISITVKVWTEKREECVDYIQWRQAWHELPLAERYPPQKPRPPAKATAKQKRFLRRLGCTVTKGLTKREASAAISAALARERGE